MLLKSPKEIKFDIRQWVLVTSFDPLRVHIFSEFYVRYCGRPYSTEGDKWKDHFRHLTNYSIQRKNREETDNYVMQEKVLFDQLFGSEAESKREEVRGKIRHIVIKTLLSAVEAGVEHRPNCFEIYGFDFLLD